MNINGLSIDLEGLEIENEAKVALLNALKVVTDSASSTVIEVKYTNGVGDCKAELKRKREIISVGVVTNNGPIYLAKAQKDDAIHIKSTSATGILTITINESTKDATPYIFPAGSNRRKFKVL